MERRRRGKSAFNVLLAAASVLLGGGGGARADFLPAHAVAGTAVTSDGAPAFSLTVASAEGDGAVVGRAWYGCCDGAHSRVEITLDCLAVFHTFEGSPLFHASGVAQDGTRYYLYVVDEAFEHFGPDVVGVTTAASPGRACEAQPPARRAHLAFVITP